MATMKDTVQDLKAMRDGFLIKAKAIDEAIAVLSDGDAGGVVSIDVTPSTRGKRKATTAPAAKRATTVTKPRKAGGGRKPRIPADQARTMVIGALPGTLREIEAKTGLSYPSARKTIQTMQEAGEVAQVSEGTRNAVYAVVAESAASVDAGEAADEPEPEQESAEFEVETSDNGDEDTPDVPGLVAVDDEDEVTDPTLDDGVTINFP